MAPMQSHSTRIRSLSLDPTQDWPFTNISQIGCIAGKEVQESEKVLVLAMKGKHICNGSWLAEHYADVCSWKAL